MIRNARQGPGGFHQQQDKRKNLT